MDKPFDFWELGQFMTNLASYPRHLSLEEALELFGKTQHELTQNYQAWLKDMFGPKTSLEDCFALLASRTPSLQKTTETRKIQIDVAAVNAAVQAYKDQPSIQAVDGLAKVLMPLKDDDLMHVLQPLMKTCPDLAHHIVRGVAGYPAVRAFKERLDLIVQTTFTRIRETAHTEKE